MTEKKINWNPDAVRAAMDVWRGVYTSDISLNEIAKRALEAAEDVQFRVPKNEFLPKEPEKALRRVRELLYDRLAVLRQCVPDNMCLVDMDTADLVMNGEKEWIKNLLDMIERS